MQRAPRMFNRIGAIRWEQIWHTLKTIAAICNSSLKIMMQINCDLNVRRDLLIYATQKTKISQFTTFIYDHHGSEKDRDEQSQLQLVD